MTRISQLPQTRGTWYIHSLLSIKLVCGVSATKGMVKCESGGAVRVPGGTVSGSTELIGGQASPLGYATMGPRYDVLSDSVPAR